ncbi:MAG: DUF6382 domain-containing protein [Lachnospiraceae bacterium]
MERKITIEESQVYREDYQMKMLYMNEINGILPVKGRGLDEKSFYDYNVSGKVSMKAMYERNKISGEDLKIFLHQFLAVVQEVEKYLLNIHCILLEPEYIFYEEKKFYFCYYPLEKQDIWEQFHKLTEYFVKKTDYEDKESVRITFVLHKETLEENYSLEKVIRECVREKEEEPFVSKNPGIWSGEYDTSQYDWIHAQNQGNLIMEETDNMWTPVKKFLNRHKKPKWGDWDGLYIEEEEL